MAFEKEGIYNSISRSPSHDSGSMESSGGSSSNDSGSDGQGVSVEYIIMAVDCTLFWQCDFFPLLFSYIFFPTCIFILFFSLMRMQNVRRVLLTTLPIVILRNIHWNHLLNE